jgi:hypothetical protein
MREDADILQAPNLGDALRRLETALAKAELSLQSVEPPRRDHPLPRVLEHDLDVMRKELVHLRREYAAQLAAMLRC